MKISDLQRIKSQENAGKIYNKVYTALDYHPALLSILSDINRVLKALHGRVYDVKELVISFRTLYTLRNYFRRFKRKGHKDGVSRDCGSKRC
ncbi:hypothetical protein GJ496_004395 [Pomphorhynchus laevis]|nr:hypothetical protein GJ496_004395 [Pomphorhynchus laevis]